MTFWQFVSGCHAQIASRDAPEENGSLIHLTQEDTRDLEKLQELQIFIHSTYKMYTGWNAKTWKSSSSADLAIISQRVDVLFRDNLPDVVQKSVSLAKCGQTLGSDAVDLCKSIGTETTVNLGTFVAGTMKMAQEAKVQAVEMVNDFREIRNLIFQVIMAIDQKLEKKRMFFQLIGMELSGLKKSLLEVKESLNKQEEFLTVLIDWWNRIENQLRHIQKSLNVLQPEDAIRLHSMRYKWEALKCSYEKYILQVSRTQDQFSDLKRSTRPGVSQSIEASPNSYPHDTEGSQVLSRRRSLGPGEKALKASISRYGSLQAKPSLLF